MGSNSGFLGRGGRISGTGTVQNVPIFHRHCGPRTTCHCSCRLCAITFSLDTETLNGDLYARYGSQRRFINVKRTCMCFLPAMQRLLHSAANPAEVWTCVSCV